MSGLLIDGQLVPVPGVAVIPPFIAGGPTWAALGPGDCRARRTTWVRQVVIHATKGLAHQHVIPGRGAGGRGKSVADFWHDDPTHSGAHIVIDNDGAVICLADLALTCAYHATVSNEWSVGIEVYQEADGGIYEAALDAAVATVTAICHAFTIPFQFASDHYAGHPIPRLLNGGPDVCGIYGHRGNTESRGWGDPGDEIFDRLYAAGADPVDLGQHEDIEVGKRRQTSLNAMDAAAGNTYRPLTVDGVLGPASIAALKRHGRKWWVDVP